MCAKKTKLLFYFIAHRARCATIFFAVITTAAANNFAFCVSFLLCLYAFFNAFYAAFFAGCRTDFITVTGGH
jgi:hypothetical protein